MRIQKAVIFGATGGIGAAFCRLVPIGGTALASIDGRGHGTSMHRIAIYDLDGTLTRRKTFTPFLLFAARRNAAWRLLLLSVWIGCMAAYKLGAINRTALKNRGLGLFVRATPDRAAQLAEDFAAHARLIESVMEEWRRDGEAGVTRVIATAAIAPVASAFGRRLGADHVLSTALGPDGRLAGANNHGAEKMRRVQLWLAECGLARDDCNIRMISDESHDAPLLDWADEGVLVAASSRLKRHATARGWRVIDRH